MMSLAFGLFTQVSGSGPLGPLVFFSRGGGGGGGVGHCLAKLCSFFDCSIKTLSTRYFGTA